ncbi:hypothetical protein CHRYSEOSP005_14670 [Chryseobacterium sp. Alg-005]|uniref:hypothetical protein n=1 Tax=Chryseobacterium sp. Alg-005 TaxID=3159516 RepID=UPI00355586E6
MTKEELLRIYSAYLPYNVTITDISNDQEFILDHDNLAGVLNDAEHLDTIRLHLYDLSYLTKEIEHAGKNFVPIKKLCDMVYYGQEAIGDPSNGDFGWGQEFGSNGVVTGTLEIYNDLTICCYSNKKGKPYRAINQFSAYQKLLEWQFNTYKLRKDQFINKATLNQKS